MVEPGNFVTLEVDLRRGVTVMSGMAHPMGAQQPQMRGKRRVAGRDHAAFAGC